jgi:hypothetical protein
MEQERTNKAMWNLNRELITDKIHLSMKGQRTKTGKFDWTSAVLDSAIISGITACTGLGTLASCNSITLSSICVLLSAVGAEFLGVLATKRGLTPSKKS